MHEYLISFLCRTVNSYRHFYNNQSPSLRVKNMRTLKYFTTLIRDLSFFTVWRFTELFRLLNFTTPRIIESSRAPYIIQRPYFQSHWNFKRLQSSKDHQKILFKHSRAITYYTTKPHVESLNQNNCPDSNCVFNSLFHSKHYSTLLKIYHSKIKVTISYENIFSFSEFKRSTIGK